nr:helix-turn-helix domain-containing protein [Clostridioides sp.]
MVFFYELVYNNIRGDIMGIGSNIKYYREKHYMTQSDLAEAVGISKNAIYNYEKNKNTPSYKIIKKMSEVFGVTPDKITAEDFQENNNSLNYILKNIKKLQSDFSEVVYNNDTKDINNETKKYVESIDEQIDKIKDIEDEKNMTIVPKRSRDEIKNEDDYIFYDHIDSITDPTERSNIIHFINTIHGLDDESLNLVFTLIDKLAKSNENDK